jgi:YidC/Oxa1 family membrane protein insertase
VFVTANILQPLIDVFEGVLTFFHDTGGFGWGFSIIFLTIVVRALLVPLAIKQYRSMQGLQRIAPQLKELQTKYKEDKQRLQQETMKLYQESKVNPFASCLPILAQLPVFFSLFYMLRVDLRQDICGQTAKSCGDVASEFSGDEKFLFIPDITDKATGWVLAVLIVLYVGSQLVSSLLTMTAATDRNQRIIFLALPFVFVGFIFSFPAGLLVYWITTNLWTVGQQQTIKRMIKVPDLPERPASDDSAPKPARGKPAAAAAAVAPSGASKSPPPPPRRKKKRSGRRR